MRRITRMWQSFMALVVSLGGSVAPLAAEEPADVARVASLIRSLGSESYPERTEAHAALARLGELPKSQLLEALKHPEPEVRLRARELLRRLKVEELWSASRVNIESSQLSAGEALAAISTQTGNRIVLGDQYATFHDQAVALADAPRSFWPLLDVICAQSGNRVRPHYDARQPGLVAISGARARYPVAYSGPVRALVTSARREFKEEFDYERLDGEVTHAFQLNLQFMWEERFRLVAYRTQCELVRAHTDAGVELVTIQPASQGWNVAGGGSRQVSMNLRLQPPPVSSAKLSALELRWGVVAVGDMASLEVADLIPNKPRYQDDVQLEIETCQPQEGGRCELVLNVIRDVIVSEPQDIFFQEHDVVLFDRQGREYRPQSESHTIGDSGVRLKLILTGESADSQPQRLVFRYPRIRSQRNVDLVFRDVPLPVAKPE